MPESDQQTLTVAAVCFSDDHQRILTVRKSDTRMFMFPGGKLEAAEDATAAAIREVDEEIGIRLTADDLMLVVFHPDAGSSDADKLALLASADLPTRTRVEGDRV